jgi:hypothetical protein
VGIGYTDPSNSRSFILPLWYSELRWKKKKPALTGRLFYFCPWAWAFCALCVGPFVLLPRRSPKYFAMKWIDPSHFEFK